MEFDSNEQLEAKFRKASPGTDVAVRLQELEARKKEVQVLLRDGKFLWEARDFDQAERKFLRVTKMDPRNDVAYNYLRLISRVRNDDAELARELISIWFKGLIKNGGLRLIRQHCQCQIPNGC